MSDTEKLLQDLNKKVLNPARESKCIIHCSYQDMWFTPDELESAIKSGRFIWGVENFELVHPQRRIYMLKKAITKLRSEIQLNEDAIQQMVKIITS